MVDSDESDDEPSNETESKVSEVKSEEERPDLKHQPEIVEEPDKMAASSNPPAKTQSTDPAKVEVRESTEGTGAEKQNA